MEDPALALILERSLALIEEGESIHVVLTRFPDFADRLGPLLDTAVRLQDGAGSAVDVPFDFLQDLGRALRSLPATE